MDNIVKQSKSNEIVSEQFFSCPNDAQSSRSPPFHRSTDQDLSDQHSMQIIDSASCRESTTSSETDEDHDLNLFLEKGIISNQVMNTIFSPFF